MFNVLSSKTLKKWMATSLVAGLLAVPSLSSAANDLPLSDIANNANRDAILKLNYAGVVTGYEDGTFKPQKEVSRAEFATMAVLALGYTKEQVKMFEGPTKFKDLPENYWANGFINLAVSKGIIKGYPDGTFKPKNTVTVAESLTVFVNGLNIDVPASTTGYWYHPFLLEANKVGLYDSTEAAAAAANREVIAKFADKFMETAVYPNGAFYDKDGNHEGTNKKLAVQKASVASVDTDKQTIQFIGQEKAVSLADNAQVYGTLVAGAEVEYILKDGKVAFVLVNTDQASIVEGIVQTGLDFTTAVGDEQKFKAIVNGEEVILEVANGVKVENAQVGQKFIAVKDQSGKISSISFSVNETTGVVEKTAVISGTNAKKEITVSGKTYKLAPNAAVTGKAHPKAEAAKATFEDIAKGDLVKLTFNKDQEVAAVEFAKLNVTGEISVDTKANTVTFQDQAYSVYTDTTLLVNEKQVSELNKLANNLAVLTFDQKGNLIKVEQGTISVDADFVTDTTAYTSDKPAAVTIDGQVYNILPSAVVKVEDETIAANTITADQLNDLEIKDLKVKVGTHDIVELAVEKQTVTGFITDKTDKTVEIDGEEYELASGVTVDADAATNDKEYTLTLDREGKVKAISSAVKTVSGAVDEVNIVNENGKVTTATLTVNGEEYTAVNADVLKNVDQFEYVTLTLNRDGEASASSVIGTKAQDNVAFKGIETRVTGDQFVYFTNVSTSLKLTKDYVVKNLDGSTIDADDIQDTDKVELWTNANNEVYLIVVE